MHPDELLRKYYSPDSLAYRILFEHGKHVSEKAREVASRLPNQSLDMRFLDEAAYLHDIGIFLTNAPAIGCFGDTPYICHGVLGRDLLDREGFPRHALVCERHIGVGITREDIERHGLPLPRRTMVPESLEEQIICYADKFFSKNADRPIIEKSVDEVRKEIGRYGVAKLEIFDLMQALFSK